MKEGLSSSEYRIQTGWIQTSDTITSSLSSENICQRGSSGFMSSPKYIMQSDFSLASHDTLNSDSRCICVCATIYLVNTLNIILVNIYLVFLKVSKTL